MGEYTEQNQFELSTESLIEKELQPHIETDQAGFKRKVFHHGETIFSFKGREEMPIFESASASQTHLLGKLPRHTAQADVEAYVAGFETQSTSPDAKANYIANKNLFGVVELALRLGSTDPTLPNLQTELQQGKYSEKALFLIDALVAANYIDDNGELVDEPNTNAEALALLYFLDDQRAKSILQKKIDSFKQQDEKRKAETKSEFPENDIEPFDPKQLVCVHATRYMPSVNEAGQYQVQSKSDATDHAFFRNTIHFTLNHKVGAHGYGSWDDAGIVLVSPFQKMTAQNGLPNVLNPIDTYWSQNPGESIVFPEETLIVVPGGKDIQGLYERKGNRIEFKSGEFLNKKELQEIAAIKYDPQILEGNRFEDDIYARLDRVFLSLESGGKLGNLCDVDKIGKVFRERVRSLGGLKQLLQRLTEENGHGFQEEFENLFSTVDLNDAILGEHSSSEVLQKIAEDMTQTVRDLMYTIVNEMSVEYAIKESEFGVQGGGGWGWGDSHTNNKMKKLAETLGLSTLPHHGTPNARMEDAVDNAFMGASHHLLSGKEHPWDWKKFGISPKGSSLLELDPETRRVVYESGYINTREEGSRFYL